MLLVSPEWKKTHLRQVMNDGHFLVNRWPPVKSLCVCLPYGLLSVGQGQTLGAHTQDVTRDFVSCLIYFYRIWVGSRLNHLSPLQLVNREVKSQRYVEWEINWTVVFPSYHISVQTHSFSSDLKLTNYRPGK